MLKKIIIQIKKMWLHTKKYNIQGIPLDSFKNRIYMWNYVLNLSPLAYCASSENSNPNNNKESLWELILRFINIWPVSQWLWSLVSLVLLYFLFSKIYNKWCARKIGYYMSNKLIVNLIVFDILLNFIIGVYYMGHRDTAFGLFMLKCPIAISPFIFIIEFVIIIILYLIFNRKK